MSERSGILMALASSALGGVASVAIRFMVATTDPVTLGALRFGLGALCLLPVALCLRARWPRGRDWIAATMGAGAAVLGAIVWASGGFAIVRDFGAPQVLAILYLGVIGSALSFFLWVSALERTTPTRVASTLTINPVTASILAAILLGETVGFNLLLGVVAVAIDIWIASTDRKGSPEAGHDD